MHHSNASPFSGFWLLCLSSEWVLATQQALSDLLESLICFNVTSRQNGLLIRRIKSQQFSFKTRIKIKTETWKLQHIKLNIHWSATTLKELVEYCASLPRAAKTAQTHQGMDTRVLWEHPVHSHPRASNAAIQLDAVGPQWYEQGAL